MGRPMTDPAREEALPQEMPSSEGITAAVAGLDALASAPLSEHPDRLARVHEVLAGALREDPEAAGSQHAPTRH